MLAVLLSAWFMAQFDYFVVNVAAPSFQRDLHAGPAALQLIIGGYAFCYAAGMITGGRLGDMLGHRRMFVIGVLAFAVTSLLCGLAARSGRTDHRPPRARPGRRHHGAAGPRRHHHELPAG